MNFQRLEQLVDDQELREADELVQNLLKSSERNKNLFDEHLPNEYESLFDYYQSKIKPTIDDLNEEKLIADERYASEWLEKLYEEVCSMHGVKPQGIIRFDLYKTEQQINKEMANELELILKN